MQMEKYKEATSEFSFFFSPPPPPVMLKGSTIQKMAAPALIWMNGI